ncbi:hypothetical protein L1887_35150 [Cichorium endivia]|nr:hypothetical protein L1887_35150 [Cichorium endivia]
MVRMRLKKNNQPKMLQIDVMMLLGLLLVLVNQGFRLPNEEEADMENVQTRLEGTALSATCSLTTSNDDDSSSTTTEPTSSISPNGYGSNISMNGRFRHITITQ